MIFNWIKKYYFYILLFIIFCFGIFLRLKLYLMNPVLWHDEAALGWNILNKSYFELFDSLRFMQIAPPLFLIFSKLCVFLFNGYNHIAICDLIIRFSPFLYGCLSIIAFYILCKKLLKTKLSEIFAILLFCLNSVLIKYSIEFKPYILDVLLCLVALNIFLKIDFEKYSLKKIIFNGCLLSLMPWFSFGSSFVIFSGFLIILSKLKNNLKQYILFILPIIISVLIYLKLIIINIYLKNKQVGMISWWENENGFVNLDLSNLVSLFNLNFHYFFADVSHLSILIVFIATIWGIILFLKEKNYKFVFIFLISILSVILASMLHLYPFFKRMIIFFIPLIILCITKILDIKHFKWSLILIFFIVIPHLLLSIRLCKITNFNKGSIPREDIIHILKNVQKNDKIVLSTFNNATFFYYNTFFKLDNDVIYFDYTNKREEFINNLPKGRYLFLIDYDTKLEQNIENLMNFLSRSSK